jgi:hypothetical protein
VLVQASRIRALWVLLGAAIALAVAGAIPVAGETLGARFLA